MLGVWLCDFPRMGGFRLLVVVPPRVHVWGRSMSGRGSPLCCCWRQVPSAFGVPLEAHLKAGVKTALRQRPTKSLKEPPKPYATTRESLRVCVLPERDRWVVAGLWCLVVPCSFGLCVVVPRTSG